MKGNVMQQPIILLDLMYTLVENMAERETFFAARGRTHGTYAEWIRREQLRLWLVALLQASGGRVILITARGDQHRQATLARIAEVAGGWQPDEAYFNERKMSPPACKHGVLHRYIFPRHGEPMVTRYLALESNPATRAMYAQHDIPAVPVPPTPWTALPTC